MAPGAGDRLLLLEAGAEPVLGGSEYLATIHGRTIGRPPELDLDAERAVQTAALQLIDQGLVSAAHDCSAGGLAVAVAEMAIASGQGVKLGANIVDGLRRDVAWFGEAPSRILLAVPNDHYERALGAHLPSPARLTPIGVFGGDDIRLGDDADIPVAAARRAFEEALRD
jgi:phosphoribosylformylglycinamidine synthase